MSRNNRDLGLRHILSVALCVAAAACGGGEGDSSSSAPASRARMNILEFTDIKLPIGLADRSYETKVEVVGGTPPFRFSIVEGQLPDGLDLDAEQGVIAGRPVRKGSFAIKLLVRDSTGVEARREFELLIDETAGGAEESQQHFKAQGATRESRQSTVTASDLTSLQAIVSSMPEGSWQRVNLNNYSAAWTPSDLRPLFGGGVLPPSKIILAWSSFAWDSNRGNLFLYGGGHANYRGNDTYLWRGSTQRWERGSLPSEMTKTPLGAWNAVDGADKAPAAAHTYDNTIFLPILDRVLVLGGAADSNGGHYLTQSTPDALRNTGPYLFDPSRAHPDKVGGSTGSHVKRIAPYPEIVGGNMWSNREAWLNATPNSKPPSEDLTNSCTGNAVEGGRDIVYLKTRYRIYRYEIRDVNDKAADIWSRVGRYYYAGSGGQDTCAYDPVRKFLVSTHQYSLTKMFIFWNLATPGPDNRDIVVAPVDPTGEFGSLVSTGTIKLMNCALEFDPVRRDFKLWCGDGRTWTLTPPDTATANGWTIVKAPAPIGLVPSESTGTGILGKWKYIPNLDIFMGLLDAELGNIWIYKPIGWVAPWGGGNVPPSVTLTAPAAGSSFREGANIALAAAATDGDGSITRVEFLANGSKIGESTRVPYSIFWSGAVVGRYKITARAIDNNGAMALSDDREISVSTGIGTQTTVTLQRGILGGYTTMDSYLSSYHKTLNFGASQTMLDERQNYSPIVRFATFQSEGGPVPDGATITSAILSIYKSTAYNMTYAAHRMLVDWSESASTWNQRLPGVGWTIPGANGEGSDYASTADATASVTWNPGWVNFDVTEGMQLTSSGASPRNFGWRLRGVSGNNNLKKLTGSEFTGSVEFRPKLVITYETQ